METLNRLKGWLGNRANIFHHAKLPDAFNAEFTLRKPFITRNGIAISIQMSGGHNCTPNKSVEMWNCPPSPLLMAYGDGTDPYPYVPLEVVAGYIDSLESLGDNHDYN